MKFHIIILIIVTFIPLKVFSQNPDRRMILKVAQDYVNAMYEADAGKMDQCLYNHFIKNGFYWKSSQENYSEITSITREQLIQIAKDWNKDQWVPEDAPEEVEILDLQEKIAMVKLTAFWGVEYLQLSKTGEQWLIVQILSQNWPRKETQEE
jgi:hypothetical protein